MNNEEYANYGSATEETGTDVLTQISELAEQQASIEREILKAEEQVNVLKAKLEDVSERQLPELMDSVGLSTFTTTSGLSINVEPVIRASIPVAQRGAAFAWLRDKGFGSLIKRVVSVSFGRGEDDKAQLLLDELAEQELEADDSSNVHPQTLKSFVTEQLESGVDIPLDLFGVQRYRRAKLSIPGAKKRK